MSGLDLRPNPAVLLTQAGIFLTALYVVKRTMLEPFLKIKDARIASTSGSQSEAESINQDVASATRVIQTRLAEALSKANESSIEIKKTAARERETIVKAAQQRAISIVGDMDKNISESLKQEMQKLPSEAQKITSHFFDILVRS